MGMLDWVGLFNQMDPETRDAMKRLASEAMTSPNVGLMLRQRVQRMFVEETWHWELLGIKPGSSQSEIERAYKALILIVHPDKARDKGRLFSLAGKARDKALGR